MVTRSLTFRTFQNTFSVTLPSQNTGQLHVLQKAEGFSTTRTQTIPTLEKNPRLRQVLNSRSSNVSCQFQTPITTGPKEQRRRRSFLLLFREWLRIMWPTRSRMVMCILLYWRSVGGFTCWNLSLPALEEV